MVTANIKNCERYYPLHKHFEAVFEYLKTVKKEDGKYIISKGNAWINPPVVRNAGSDIYETHRNFIDIHYILSGSQTFGCCNPERLEIFEKYDENTDCEFLKGNGDFVELSEGDFIIVFPEDAHNVIVDFDKTCELVTVVAKVRLDSED